MFVQLLTEVKLMQIRKFSILYFSRIQADKFFTLAFFIFSLTFLKIFLLFVNFINKYLASGENSHLEIRACLKLVHDLVSVNLLLTLYLPIGL